MIPHNDDISGRDSRVMSVNTKLNDTDLEENDRVIFYEKKVGIIGTGVVIEESKRVTDRYVTGIDIKLALSAINIRRVLDKLGSHERGMKNIASYRTCFLKDIRSMILLSDTDIIHVIDKIISDQYDDDSMRKINGRYGISHGAYELLYPVFKKYNDIKVRKKGYIPIMLDPCISFRNDLSNSAIREHLAKCRYCDMCNNNTRYVPIDKLVYKELSNDVIMNIIDSYSHVCEYEHNKTEAVISPAPVSHDDYHGCYFITICDKN